MSTRILAAAAALLVAAATLIGVPTGAAVAAGSPELYPTNIGCTATTTGACRANIEWRTNTYGPPGSSILRRTIFNVYLQAGEVLTMGSSAVGVGSGDILLYNPGVVTNEQQVALPALVPGTNGTSCAAQRAAGGADPAMGRITSRALELAGPRSADGTANPGGWVPCVYTAPVTGIYKAMFIGPAGLNASTDGTPTGDIQLTAASNFGTQQGSSIAAFDLVVRANAATATATRGRVFTYALTAFTGGNGRPIDAQLYVTATTGFKYRLDTNGLDPNGFLIYGNEAGFLDPQGNPLNHDVLGNNGTLATLQGGVSLAAPQFPISFFPLADETIQALGIPQAPVAPQFDSFTYEGSVGGADSRFSKGGVFRGFANTHGQASIVISRDGVNFDPGNPANRVLRRVVDAGAIEIAWDGLDNAGDPFPVGTDYPVRATVRTGIFHFPIIDAENSTRGGPSFTLLNPPGGVCPFGNSACTTSFYDDRGYSTSVADVGTAGSVLCGLNPPSPANSNLGTGYVSTTDQRRWGSATGGNTNVSCTGSFGDAKGLDSWTAYPGQTRQVALNVLPALPGIDAADDSRATRVNTPLSVPAGSGVLANDSGGGLTVTTTAPVTTAQGGTATVNANGSYSYTPPTGFVGTDTFTYSIRDADGNTDTATVTITVNPAPVVVNDSGSTPVDTPLSVPTSQGVLANDTLPPGTVISGVTQPAHGTLSINPDGSYVYTPNPGYTGPDQFTYTVRTTDGSTATGTVNLTVTPLPTAANDTGRTGAGQPLAVPAGTGLLANDTGTGLRVQSNTQPANGSVSVSPDGSYAYTPNPGFSGFDTFTYTVVDASGATATATATITVDPAPVANPDTGATYQGTPLPVPASAGLLANDTGQGLAVQSVGDPPNGSILWNPDGSYTYTPDAGFIGTDTVSYTVVDRNGLTAVSTLTITVSPIPVANDDTGRTPQDTPLTVPAASGLLLNDSAPAGTVVTGTTTPTSGTVVVQPDGGYTYTPALGFTGTASFDYTIRDPGGFETTATVTITVDPRPVANGDTGTTGAGVPLIIPAPGLLGNDTGVQLTITGTTSPSNGTLTVNLDGSYAYTPNQGFTGTDSFTYTVTDVNGLTSTATVTITVVPGPTASPSSHVTYLDTAITVPAGTGMLANDAGDAVTVTSVGSPGNGTLTWAADGSFVYTPGAGFTGTDTFPYTITDSRGSTATSTVTIRVDPVPSPVNDTGRTTVDVPLDVPAATGVLSNDAVPAGTVVVPAATTAPAHGTVTMNADGSYRYVPAPGYTGPDSFRYTIETPDGYRTTARVDLTVVPLPIATDDAYSTGIDTPVVIGGPGVLGNDRGDGIRVTGSVTSPSNGTLVSLGAGGGFRYEPAPGFTGVDTFDYEIVDTAGNTTTATVTITVLGAPIARPDSTQTIEGVPVTVPASEGVLANDAPAGATIIGNTSPANGSVVLNPDGSYTYTPAPGFVGTDGFDYTIEDAAGQTATTTVTIDVVGAVSAVADVETTPAGVTLVVPAASGVLSNDGAPAGSTVASYTQPPGGTVTVNPDGSYVYRPDPGFTGDDIFSYTVVGPGGDTATTTVTITVAAATPATDDATTTTSGTPVTIDPTANDPAVGDYVPGSLQLIDPVTGVPTGAVTVPGQGTWTVGPDDTVTFAPLPGFTGVATPVAYLVDGTAGGPYAATITVTVTAAPGAGGGGVALPTTGADPTTGLALGILLLLAGAVLRRFGRRRVVTGA